MKCITLKGSVLIFLLGMVSIFTPFTCNKDESKINIVLHDKPLDLIQSSIQGKWKLQKVTGGICNGCYPPPKNNPYMIITGDHIVAGNDLRVTLDTIIVWKRDRDIFQDSTYLLSYRDSKSYAFPIYKVVDQIRNDTLVLIDDASDAFYYYYTK